MSITGHLAAQASLLSLRHTPEEYGAAADLGPQRMGGRRRCGAAGFQVGLGPGASCLDAGCGPGETMRAMAERVWPGPRAGYRRGRLAGCPGAGDAASPWRGHRHCSFSAQDLTAGEPIPGAPFDLVCARLLLFHLPQRRGRAEAAASPGMPSHPGGHLLVQDYDLRGISTRCPSWTGSARCCGVRTGAFGAVGARRVGRNPAAAALRASHTTRPPTAPTSRAASSRSPPAASSWRTPSARVLPTALAYTVSPCRGRRCRLAGLESPVTPRASPAALVLWPLLVSAWKRKERA